jgi:hypothetical protein
MLAQNFKTPTDLGISDAEFEALVKVLGMLERGEIKEAPEDAGFECVFDLEEEPKFFRMRTTNAVAECGATCCILGFAWFVSGTKELFRGCTSRLHSANELFFPSRDAAWSGKPEQGAIALRNYLTSGEPRWAEALAD